LAIGGLVAPPAAFAQTQRDTVPVVTLQEARRRAIASDPDAVAARSQVETAEWERRVAITDLITPNLNATTNYTHFSEPFFNFGTGRVSPNSTNAIIQANYSVLGSGKFAERKRASASLESAEASETAINFRVSLATDASFFSVLAARELSRLAADRLKRAQEQFGIARVRVSAGEAIATDSLQLLLEVNRARLDVLRRDSALAVSRYRLGRQIGQPGPVDALAIDSAAPPPLPFTREQAVAELRTSGPELLVARAEEKSADARLGVERGGYLPDISIGATKGYYDQEFFPNALSRGQFAVTVSLPIWDGGHRELAVARARAQRTVARAERQDRERASGEVMTEAYAGYETARAGVELALVGVAVAGENYRVQRARYREGATTILDLLEAQVSLTEAETTLVQSRYAARLALANIESLLGRRVFETSRPINR
jgi:outer membrane protein TolC